LPVNNDDCGQPHSHTGPHTSSVVCTGARPDKQDLGAFAPTEKVDLQVCRSRRLAPLKQAGAMVSSDPTSSSSRGPSSQCPPSPLLQS